MTTEELIEAFGEDGNEEYLQFDRVQNPRSKRPDLHAFLLLDELVPGTSAIVAGASHDQISIGVHPEELAAVISIEQILELVRCGVFYSKEGDSLSMFA